MRHGRKSRSHLVDGYKRHVLRDLDSGLVPAVGVTAANIPEAAGATQIAADLAAQQVRLAELHIDRAYLASVLVPDRPEDLEIFCKAWRVRNGPRFAKTDFTLDWGQGLLVCPAGQQMPFTPGGKVQFPATVWRPARCAPGAPPAPMGAASRSTPTSGCSPSSANGSSPHPGGPSSASASWSSTPWPRSAAGKAAAPATWGSPRTCSIFAAARSSITCTSSPVRPGRPSRPPEHR
jgi:hypothetical protein